jgi:hypothetical protein
MKQIYLLIFVSIFSLKSYSQCDDCITAPTIHTEQITNNGYHDDERTYKFTYSECGNGNITILSVTCESTKHANLLYENVFSIILRHIQSKGISAFNLVFPASCYKIVANKTLSLDGTTPTYVTYSNTITYCNEGCCSIPVADILDGGYDQYFKSAPDCMNECQSICNY